MFQFCITPKPSKLHYGQIIPYVSIALKYMNIDMADLCAQYCNILFSTQSITKYWFGLKICTRASSNENLTILSHSGQVSVSLQSNVGGLSCFLIHYENLSLLLWISFRSFFYTSSLNDTEVFTWDN